MGRYAYEISRDQSAEGSVIADSPEDARQKILDDLSDIDWDSSEPDLWLDSRDLDG